MSTSMRAVFHPRHDVDSCCSCAGRWEAGRSAASTSRRPQAVRRRRRARAPLPSVENRREKEG